MRATTMIVTRSAVIGGRVRTQLSSLLHRDGFEGVRDMFQRVGAVFEQTAELTCLHDVHGVMPANVETGEQRTVDVVRLVFQPVQFDPGRFQRLRGSQQLQTLTCYMGATLD